MTLGEKLRQARLEAGLSQRQLCGDEITRNMLSQIEHDTARPSMDTLRYLAGRLGKSLGYFLDEEEAALPNFSVIRRTREAWDNGDMAEVVRALEGYRGPDAVFDREKGILEALGYLGMAEKALEDNRRLYALELLARAAEASSGGYFGAETERRRLLLLARTGGQKMAEIAKLLPGLDEELLIRAEGALEAGDVRRCAALLEAAEDRDSDRWSMLRGRAHMGLGEYEQAAQCLENGEERDPRRAALLEKCYRELGDYKMAYYYACKVRDRG